MESMMRDGGESQGESWASLGAQLVKNPPSVEDDWRIPGIGEAGGLPSMGSHRVGAGKD